MTYPLKNWTNIKTGYRFMQPTFYSAHHLGLDKICNTDTTLYAPIAGRVEHQTSNEVGNAIYFYGSDKRLWRFMHLNFRKPEGDYKEGDTIGQTGNTGISTAPHLHIDISKDYTLNLNDLGHFLDPELIIKPQPIMNYDNKIIRNSANGEYAFVLAGKRRVIIQDRAGLAALTAIDRNLTGEDIITLSEADYLKVPKGDNF